MFGIPSALIVDIQAIGRGAAILVNKLYGARSSMLSGFKVTILYIIINIKICAYKTRLRAGDDPARISKLWLLDGSDR